MRKPRKSQPRGRPFPARAVFRALWRAYGPQGWWPGRTPFEVMVGAILTQNAAWINVERAIARLRRRRALTPRALHALPERKLADLIRPAGYFRVKARRLRSLTGLLAGEFGGRLDRLFRLSTAQLRERLLATHGIGPETADSILLYAAGRPVFVVDAYTRRVLQRHGWARGDESYDELAAAFTRRLPRDTRLFNEYHALLVALGKRCCRPKPRCETCPLRRWPPLPERIQSRGGAR